MNNDVAAFMQKSYDCLEDAQILLEKERYDGTVNRTYYAFFDAIRALLSTKDIFSKTHSGTHAKFRELFIKTTILPLKYNQILEDIYDLRQGGDYDAEIDIDETQAKTAFEGTKDFINEVENYLKTQNFL
ncbi:MAG: HEPN domain-containing protein [Emticicia sp.]|nr:HEPN domain-containing protein [Emticicia sp.]